MTAAEHWAEYTRRLPTLVVGDTVHIHNQPSPHPNKWDKPGKVIGVHQFEQIIIEAMA